MDTCNTLSVVERTNFQSAEKRTSPGSNFGTFTTRNSKRCCPKENANVRLKFFKVFGELIYTGLNFDSVPGEGGYVVSAANRAWRPDLTDVPHEATVPFDADVVENVREQLTRFTHERVLVVLFVFARRFAYDSYAVRCIAEGLDVSDGTARSDDLWDHGGLLVVR
jgi:hypothetical protein